MRRLFRSCGDENAPSVTAVYIVKKKRFYGGDENAVFITGFMVATKILQIFRWWAQTL